MYRFALAAFRARAIIALCLVPLLGFAAQGDGPDIDPSKTSVGWWDVNGGDVDVPGAYVQNNAWYFTVNSLRGYIATSQLINGHVSTSGGKNLAHMHYDRSLDTVEQSQANHWFDCLFGAQETPPRTSRISAAYVDKNCHAHAFSTLGRGAYNYWFGWSGVYNDAAGAECNPHLKSSVAAGDLLMYGGGEDHTSIVHAVHFWYYKTTKLRWKAGFSGVYEQAVDGSFDTPKYLANPFPAVGGAFDPNVWTWDKTGIGDGPYLYGGPTKLAPGDQGKYVLRKK